MPFVYHLRPTWLCLYFSIVSFDFFRPLSILESFSLNSADRVLPRENVPYCHPSGSLAFASMYFVYCVLTLMMHFLPVVVPFLPLHASDWCCLFASDIPLCHPSGIGSVFNIYMSCISFVILMYFPAWYPTFSCVLLEWQSNGRRPNSQPSSTMLYSRGLSLGQNAVLLRLTFFIHFKLCCRSD